MRKKRLFEDRVEEAMIELKEKKRVAPIDYRTEPGQPMVFDLILDVSSSVRDHYELMTLFNEQIIPPLYSAIERYHSATRLGCVLFSHRLVPAWKGFKKPQELGPAPLNHTMFNRPARLQDSTALYRAMQQGILWTTAAVKALDETSQGNMPYGRIIVLTDGVNNASPHRYKAIPILMKNANDPYDFLKGSLFCLKTENGLSENQFQALGDVTSFKPIDFDTLVTQEASRGRMINLFRSAFSSKGLTY